MAGETDLATLLSAMNPVLDPEVYVFTSVQDEHALAGLPTLMQFREDEAITAILPKSAALGSGLSHSFECQRITLQVHSALEAVGLTAAVSNALSEHRIACNIVAGYFHDHLFVAQSDAESAMAILHSITDPSQIFWSR